jgi:hypothetical protein
VLGLFTANVLVIVPPPPGFRPLHEWLDPAERRWRRPRLASWTSEGVTHSNDDGSTRYHMQRIRAAEAECRAQHERGEIGFWGWWIEPMDRGVGPVELPTLLAWPTAVFSMQRDRLAHPPSRNKWIAVGSYPALAVATIEALTAVQVKRLLDDLKARYVGRKLTLGEALDAACTAGFWDGPCRLQHRDDFEALIACLCGVPTKTPGYGLKTIRKRLAERRVVGKLV